ncbi:kinase-like domain-containing protein [Annulohypoxylon maeteangense]|uniref:kinase-like domain-containing protein n=1 Tax=Annulohypoxylon maeteangense TaxID=1927788 RepID=UPI002007665D|nr:kinase-like domain-containing protein [Annulohypoxylon maeteangense]KAI0883989.1 kinase-like domain-containing protein [Annulohypoxylon maeteangense]
MSRPPTPSNRAPHHSADFRFKTNGTACEWGEAYHPGGYHPVHIGDIIQSRYRVLRKLGYGSYSTVWLVVDHIQPNRLMALKIATASMDQGIIDKEVTLHRQLAAAGTQHNGSPFLVMLQTYFQFQGPNGTHACFVLDVMGPHLTEMLHLCPEFQIGEPWERRFTKQFAKKVLQDVLHGLQFLHENGVVHGDLHTGNILVNVRSIKTDEASIKNLEQSTDTIQCSSLRRLDGKTDPWAPEYLIQPEPLYEYTSLDLEPLAKITDLGSAFLEDYPPAETVTAVAFRAPELIFGRPFGKGIDIWSFGCLLFELLTGSSLFCVSPLGGDKLDESINDEHLIQFFDLLGPLPETLFSRWRRRWEYFDQEGKRLYPVNHADEGSDDLDMADTASDDAETSELGSFDSTETAFLAPAFGYDALEKRFRDKKTNDIDEKEETQLLQLMHWVLQYDPAQRPSPTEILEHPWFN